VQKLIDKTRYALITNAYGNNGLIQWFLLQQTIYAKEVNITKEAVTVEQLGSYISGLGGLIKLV